MLAESPEFINQKREREREREREKEVNYTWKSAGCLCKFVATQEARVYPLRMSVKANRWKQNERWIFSRTSL